MLSQCSRRISGTPISPLRIVQTTALLPYASHIQAFQSHASFRRNFRLVYEASPPERSWPKHVAYSAFTILANPKITAREDIVRLLSSSTAYSDAVAYSPNKERGLVILATPLFTSWLEDKTFISEVIQSLFSARTQSTVNVSTLAAVVDGLPAGVGSTNPICHQRAEGLAFLSGDCKSMLPGLWDSNLDATQKGITFFSISPNVRPGYLPFNTEFAQSVVIDVTVPLANTLFRNGRHYTLLASKWQSVGRASSFELLHHEERPSQRINMTRFSPRLFPFQRTPLTVLTPTRTIASGLGNIVSQLLDEEGKAIPASRELEATIDDYLEAKKVPKQAVAVWALVTPEIPFAIQNEMRDRVQDEILADYSENLESLCNDKEVIRKFWVTSPKRSSYAGKWIANGASLHRILSGGGGWGAKQGLLSLDPDTSFVAAPNDRWNFDKHGIWEDGDQRKALGDIVKTGSKIQFLVAHEPFKTPPIRSQGPNYLDLAVGCIPSTIDDIPPSDSEGNETVERHRTATSLRLINGHFGAQSETGFFIKHSVISGDDQSSNFTFVSSKIDVPHSVWIARRRLRA